MTEVGEIACEGDDGRSYTVFMFEAPGAPPGKGRVLRLDDGQEVFAEGGGYIAPSSGLTLTPLVKAATKTKA